MRNRNTEINELYKQQNTVTHLRSGASVTTYAFDTEIYSPRACRDH